MEYQSERATQNVEYAHLIDEIIQQNPRALHLLYQNSVAYLYAYAIRIVRDANQAEEIVEDVFVYVWQNADKWQQARGSVQGWLTMLCKSRALDCLRKAHHDRLTLHPEPWELIGDEQLCSPDPLEWDIRLFSSALQRACNSLSEMEMYLIELVYLRELTHEESVDITGLPLGTVKSHLRRGMLKLQESIANPVATLRLADSTKR